MNLAAAGAVLFSVKLARFKTMLAGVAGAAPVCLAPIVMIGACVPAISAMAQAVGNQPVDTRVDTRAKQRPEARTSNDARGLKAIEAGVGDVGPLSISARELRVDLRQAAGFDRVYQLPWQTGASGSKPGGFVRFDSGIAAVFPRSEYRQTPWGQVAEIPAGTTFYIGRLPDSVLQAGTSSRSPSSLLRVDRGVDMAVRDSRPASTAAPRVATRVDMRAPAQPETKGEEIRRDPPSLMNDPKLRERWIDSLGEPEKKKPAPVKAPASK